MLYFLLIGTITCFVCGLLLSIPLMLFDVFRWGPEILPRTDSYLEKPLAGIFGLIQLVAFAVAAGAGAYATTLKTGQHIGLLDAVCFSTLHLYSGSNLARAIRRGNAIVPIWATPLVYCISLSFTAIEFAALMKNANTLPDYPFFLHLTIPPLLSSAVQCSQLSEHNASGGNSPSYRFYLISAFSANAITALCQLSGALTLLIMDNKTTDTLRYGILLLCVSSHHISSCVNCLALLKKGVKKAWDWMSMRGPRYSDNGGALRLNSFPGSR